MDDAATDEVLVHADGVLEQPLDDELMLLVPGTDVALHLNAGASRVWEALGAGTGVEAALRLVAEHCAQPLEQVTGDSAPVLDLLVERGLLVPRDARA